MWDQQSGLAKPVGDSDAPSTLRANELGNYGSRCRTSVSEFILLQGVGSWDIYVPTPLNYY